MVNPCPLSHTILSKMANLHLHVSIIDLQFFVAILSFLSGRCIYETNDQLIFLFFLFVQAYIPPIDFSVLAFKKRKANKKSFLLFINYFLFFCFVFISSISFLSSISSLFSLFYFLSLFYLIPLFSLLFPLFYFLSSISSLFYFLSFSSMFSLLFPFLSFTTLLIHNR